MNKTDYEKTQAVVSWERGKFVPLAQRTNKVPGNCDCCGIPGHRKDTCMFSSKDSGKFSLMELARMDPQRRLERAKLARATGALRSLSAEGWSAVLQAVERVAKVLPAMNRIPARRNTTSGGGGEDKAIVKYNNPPLVHRSMLSYSTNAEAEDMMHQTMSDIAGNAEDPEEAAAYAEGALLPTWVIAGREVDERRAAELHSEEERLKESSKRRGKRRMNTEAWNAPHHVSNDELIFLEIRLSAIRNNDLSDLRAGHVDLTRPDESAEENAKRWWYYITQVDGGGGATVVSQRLCEKLNLHIYQRERIPMEGVFEGTVQMMERYAVLMGEVDGHEKKLGRWVTRRFLIKALVCDDITAHMIVGSDMVRLYNIAHTPNSEVFRDV